MPRILIVYGTTDGHTAKVAARLAETLRLEGVHVDVFDAGGRGLCPHAEDYTAVIVAASVHASGYQRAVRQWVRANVAPLRDRPSVFVSVCLGVLQHDPKVEAELQAIVNGFVQQTGWQPAVTKIVAGALCYTRYGWLKRWVMRRIVAKAHGDVDTTRDYEYTDWADVQSFGRDFSRRITQPAAAMAPEPVRRTA